jgi:NADH-quinone oxidoreductase subunit L
MDNIYEMVIVIPLQKFSQAFLFRFVDKGVIDGAINGSGRLTGAFSNALRRLQTGVTPHYITMFVSGILLVLGWLLFRNGF